METFKSEEVTLGVPAEVAFAKFDNLQGLGEMIKGAPEGQIPADKKEMLDKIKVTEDTITMPGGPVGEVKLRKVRSEAPVLIELVGEGTPVPMSLKMHLTPMPGETCVASIEIGIEVPKMLAPMIKGPLRKMTDDFAKMLRQVPFN